MSLCLDLVVAASIFFLLMALLCDIVGGDKVTLSWWAFPNQKLNQYTALSACLNDSLGLLFLGMFKKHTTKYSLNGTKMLFLYTEISHRSQTPVRDVAKQKAPTSTSGEIAKKKFFLA